MQINFDNIPQELKNQKRWVLWKYEMRGGKQTKPPFQVSGAFARNNDPVTWDTFDSIFKTYNQGGWEGIGFELGGDYQGIDLDHVKKGGNIFPWAQELISNLKSYTETSPSGTGYHILLKNMNIDLKKCKKAMPNDSGIEIYKEARYLTTTGIFEFDDCRNIVEASPFLESFCKREGLLHIPQEETILDRARVARNGLEFIALFDRGDLTAYSGDHSAADLALCNHLAFWTGANSEKMDLLFRQSALMRSKWDERHNSNGNTYGQMTIDTAVKNCNTIVQNPKLDKKKKVQDNTPSTLLTDLANSRLYAKTYRDKICYCNSLGWVIWNGIKWERDEVSLTEHYAKKIADSILEGARDVADPDIRMSKLKEAIKIQAKNRIINMVDLAQSEMAISGDVFDTHIHLLNTESCLVNLKDGSTISHNSELYITQQTGADFAIDAVCPRWDEFLMTIFDNNLLMIKFVQRLTGYCATGSVIEECLPIFYGSGANGKSTFLKIIMTILGDYAAPAPQSLLIKKENTSELEIFSLRGKRMVTAFESKRGAALNEGLVKWVTGRDKLKGRTLYKEFIDFEPTHKIILCTNHKPRASGDDDAIWRRLKLVSFLKTIPEDQRNPELADEILSTEKSGILNWIIIGAMSWYENRLQYPDEIKEATAQYRIDSDSFLRFLDENTEPLCGFNTRAGELRMAYESWCKENGEYIANVRFCNEILRQKGFIQHREETGMFWENLSLTKRE